jgi:hypothetical protein
MLRQSWLMPMIEKTSSPAEQMSKPECSRRSQSTHQQRLPVGHKTIDAGDEMSLHASENKQCNTLR